MATKKRRTRRKAHHKAKIVVSKTKHRRRRRVSGTIGSTAIGKTRRRRRIGATSARGKMGILKEIGFMVIGAGAGILTNNLILRPIEEKLAQKMPMAGKLMGAAHAILGGYIAIKAKGTVGRTFGVAILSGGANTLLRQLNIEKHLPGISGDGDNWQTVKIPISGSELHSMVAGLMSNGQEPNWGMVAGEEMSGSEDYVSGEEMSGSEDFLSGSEDYVSGEEMNGSEDYVSGSEIGESELGRRFRKGAKMFADLNKRSLPYGANRGDRRYKQFFNRTSSMAPGSGSGDYRLRSMVGESELDAILPAKGSYH